jgi:hypothetical protein
VTRRESLISIVVVALLIAGTARADMREQETIKSLENETVEIHPGRVIMNSSDLARDNYREFLDLVTDDPSLSAEAMRRLGDLELEASEAAQLAENIEGLEKRSYDNAGTTPCCTSSDALTRSAGAWTRRSRCSTNWFPGIRRRP